MIHSKATHEQYFERAHGRWSGYFAFEITKPGRLLLQRAPFDVLQSCLLHLLVRLWGRLPMSTQVDYQPAQQRVEHHMCLRLWGRDLYLSHKFFELSEDGASFLLRGTESLWPRHRARDVGVHRGLVLPDGAHARYQMPWQGRSETLSTALQPREFCFEIDTAWGRVSGRMTRQSALDKHGDSQQELCN